VFGADLIAGFPTESEAMFERTLGLVDDCGLTYLHVFRYSPRPGTPAARMPDVAAEVRKARAARLRAAGEAARRRHFAAEVGTAREILVEEDRTGRTPHYALVELDRAAVPGDIVTARITGVRDDRLVGRVAA